MRHPLSSAPLSVYLHIPFCTTKCTYCAFNTYTHLEHLIPAFVTALCQEIAFVGRSNPGLPVHTIYFGGGTPSLLTPSQFNVLIEALYTHFRVLPDCEITVEANPNDVDLAYLTGLHEIGVNRLSIGMQSAQPGELHLFDRRHDVAEVLNAVAVARAAGFTSINLDLIYGVPHQSLLSWQGSLMQAIDLKPEHISLYALGLEAGTAMHHWVARGMLPVPDDDLAADMYEIATEWLAQAGYLQYEISNWAQPGHESRHNLQYWRNLPYLGLGPGAHGFAGGVRYATLLSPQRYIKALAHDDDTGDLRFPCTPATAEVEQISREGEISETLITGLRLLVEGVSRADFIRRFGVDVMALHGETLRHHASMGLLAMTDTHLHVTRKGRLLTNVIFRDLV